MFEGFATIGHVAFRAFSTKMNAAFALVSPEKHGGAKDWKCPIDAFIRESEMKAVDVTIEDIKEAVEFMTATKAYVTGPMLLAKPSTTGECGYAVRAQGYRAGPAGP